MGTSELDLELLFPSPKDPPATAQDPAELEAAAKAKAFVQAHFPKPTAPKTKKHTEEQVRAAFHL